MTVDQRSFERSLGLGRVDGDELSFLLTQRFERAQYTTERRIDFPDATRPLVTLEFGRNNNLCSIVPGGADLADEVAQAIVDQVQASLLAPPVSMVSRAILFGNVPTEGYWRFKDKLVIRRAPDEAPRPVAMMGQYPLVLEVGYDGAEDGFTNNIRRERESLRWSRLMTLLVPGLQLPRRTEFNQLWVVPLEDPLSPGPHTSIEAQEVYLFPGMHGNEEAGLSSRGHLPEIELAEVAPDTIRPGQILVLPRSTETCLDIFRGLTASAQEKILRAAFWLNHSSDVWRLSKSASYQSLIQAVETLTEVPRNQPRCGECGREQGAGPTALFAQFLDTYAPPLSDREPARSLLYGIRSSLSHGNSLFHMDQAYVFNRHTPKPSYEHLVISQARGICRRAIVNWLLAQSGL